MQKFNNAVRLSKLPCIIKMENYGTLASVGTKWIHGNAKFNKKTTKSLCGWQLAKQIYETTKIRE